MMKRIVWLTWVLAMILSVPAFAEEPPQKPDGTKELPANFIMRQIRPGDTLKVTVWKYSDLNATLIVGPEGYISYSFLGEIPVAGKTVEDVRKLITDKLDQQYIANPKVDIQMETQNLTIFVAGEVMRPGSYAFQPGLDPAKAVALAGGFTDFASRKALIIRRDVNGRDVEIKADLKKLMKGTQDREQYQLQPGDMVVIKRSWF